MVIPCPMWDTCVKHLTLNFNLDPNLWPWPMTLICKQGIWPQTVMSKNNFGIWPLTLTYNAKVNSLAKYQGSARRVHTNKQMDRRTLQVHYPPALLKLQGSDIFLPDEVSHMYSRWNPVFCPASFVVKVIWTCESGIRISGHAVVGEPYNQATELPWESHNFSMSSSVEVKMLMMMIRTCCKQLLSSIIFPITLLSNSPRVRSRNKAQQIEDGKICLSLLATNSKVNVYKILHKINTQKVVHQNSAYGICTEIQKLCIKWKHWHN